MVSTPAWSVLIANQKNKIMILKIIGLTLMWLAVIEITIQCWPVGALVFCISALITYGVVTTEEYGA